VDDCAFTPAERALFAALHARGIRFLIIGLGAAVLEGAPMQPPAFGGDGTADGLRSFAKEYDGSIEHEIDGVTIRVLPLERVIASKRASGRAKDEASLPALEATLRAKQS
jgi:hypothetical protein